MKMLRMPVPVVAAVHGFALGGGCEFQMHADTTVAHAEANRALAFIPGYAPPVALDMPMAGPAGKEELLETEAQIWQQEKLPLRILNLPMHWLQS